MIRYLVGSEAALNQAAWETLREIVGLLPAHQADAAPAIEPSKEASETPRVRAKRETPPVAQEVQPAKEPEVTTATLSAPETGASSDTPLSHPAQSPLSCELERSQLTQCFYVSLHCSTHGEYRIGVPEAPGNSHPCPICNVPCECTLLGRGGTRRPLPFWNQTDTRMAPRVGIR